MLKVSAGVRNTWPPLIFANKHLYAGLMDGIKVQRSQFIPDGKSGIVIEYGFQNTGEQDQKVDFTWTGHSDLRPVWLGERTGMVDGPDRANWQEDIGAWSVKDSLNDWFVVFGTTSLAPEENAATSGCNYNPAGNGVAASLKYSFSLPAGASFDLPIIIAGSSLSLDEARQTFTEMYQHTRHLLEAKQRRYLELASKSRLTIPDKPIEMAFNWLKYNTDWLIRDVPDLGRGLSAGIPDYPWWFGVDNEYSLQGALTIGRYDIVYETIELIHHLSEVTNGNGRIIHEASTNGVVFNPGNINETPQFASLIWFVFQWTGDRAFLEKYYPTVKNGLEWLLREKDGDGNLLPDGFGMMEIHGLDSEMIDVAAYTQRAFSDASEMAALMGEQELAGEYRKKAEQLREIINTDFWVPEFRSYADFIGTTEQALHLIEDALVRADTLNKPWAVEELSATQKRIANYPPDQKQGFVLHHNWVVNTPMEMGIADSSKAIAALETARRFVNPFGVFVTGIDRDDSAGKDEGSFAAGKKVFNYTGAVMTLPTGVQAIAENNYGHPDRALGYLQRMTRTFGYALPGSIYEVSPDFGMITQAWNLYSYGIPIVQQFFGIRPNAGEQTIRIQPQMPTAWEQASLENVQIGDNHIDMIYRKQGAQLFLELRQTDPEWTFEVAFPKDSFSTWEQNGQLVEPEIKDGMARIQTKGDIVLKMK